MTTWAFELPYLNELTDALRKLSVGHGASSAGNCHGSAQGSRVAAGVGTYLNLESVTVNARIRLFEPGIGRDLAMFQHQDCLYNTSDSAGPLKMADVRLDRRNIQGGGSAGVSKHLPIYHASNAGFLPFTIGCAMAPSMPALMALRFLEACFGATCLTIGGGTIADIMPPAQRGRAMALWGMGPLLGPVLGPISGGFLAAAEGWRWVFWVVTIVAAVASFVCALALRKRGVVQASEGSQTVCSGVADKCGGAANEDAGPLPDRSHAIRLFGLSVRHPLRSLHHLDNYL